MLLGQVVLGMQKQRSAVPKATRTWQLLETRDKVCVSVVVGGRGEHEMGIGMEV